MKIKICFVVETTYKMTPYLRDVQYSIGETVDKIRFYNQGADIRIAMITYRDYKDCEPVGFVPWQTDDNFFEAWDDLERDSRVAWFSENDAADVAGGVNCALKLGWSDADYRLVFHYGISPAHGKQFYGPGIYDEYPEGDPSGKDLLRDMYEFSCMPCDYTFFRITSAVDTMLSLMDESYTGGGIFRVEDLDTTESCTSAPDSEEE